MNFYYCDAVCRGGDDWDGLCYLSEAKVDAIFEGKMVAPEVEDDNVLVICDHERWLWSLVHRMLPKLTDDERELHKAGIQKRLDYLCNNVYPLNDVIQYGLIRPHRWIDDPATGRTGLSIETIWSSEMAYKAESEWIEKWQLSLIEDVTENSRLSPSIYFMTRSDRDELAWAIASVRLARELRPNAIITPHISFRYETGAKSGQFLPRDVWRSLLAGIRPYIDGVMLWSNDTHPIEVASWKLPDGHVGLKTQAEHRERLARETAALSSLWDDTPEEIVKFLTDRYRRLYRPYIEDVERIRT